jgi:membrane protease YdiL (CAAX protease family)
LINSRNKLAVSRKYQLIEVLCVIVAAVLLIKLLRGQLNGRGDWFLTPFILITAALVPTRLRKKGLAEIGLCIGQPKIILRVLFATCLIVFGFLLAGVFLLKKYDVELPLSPIIPEGRWFSWLAYQFMYVAVAEEIFFRGYFQSNVLSLLTQAVQKNRAFTEILSIIMSAAAFAISHCVLRGSVTEIITFFPGLIFGWLLVKTKSLLTPILFHGLANACYGFIAAAFA